MSAFEALRSGFFNACRPLSGGGRYQRLQTSDQDCPLVRTPRNYSNARVECFESTYESDEDDNYDRENVSTSWTAISVHKQDGELEICLYPGLGKILALTLVYAFCSALAYPVYLRFRHARISRMAIVFIGSLFLLFVAMWYRLTLMWLDVFSTDRLVINRDQCTLEHVYLLFNGVLHKLGFGRLMTVPPESVQARVVNYPIRCLTGPEMSTALDIREGIRFGMDNLEPYQQRFLRDEIIDFVGSQPWNQPMGNALPAISRPANTRISVTFNKDIAIVEVPSDPWNVLMMGLITYELIMGIIALTLGMLFALNSPIRDNWILAMPLGPVILILMVIASGFLWILFAALGSEMVEVSRLKCRIYRKYWMGNAWLGSMLPKWLIFQEPQERTVSIPCVRVFYDEGVPMVEAQGMKFGSGLDLDDLMWIKYELEKAVDAMPC